MLNPTKEQAIAEHRKMWRWIAKMTKQEKRIILKEEYLTKVLKLKPRDFPNCCCFLCEYTRQFFGNRLARCRFCPLNWGTPTCAYEGDNEQEEDGLFLQWQWSCCIDDWEQAAKLAEVIAELPEIRKESK